MNFHLKALLFLLLSTFQMLAIADSPLTSTPFSKAYMEIDQVRKAAENQNMLTEELAAYIHNPQEPIVYRLAVINAISWSIDGTKNFQIYLDYILRNDSSINEDNFTRLCTPDQLICLAYLKAMDDYFDVGYAFELAELALEKYSDDNRPFSVYIVHALIKAQIKLDEDWCEVYQATASVRDMTLLEMDMKDGAQKIIFEYMDLYKGDCTSEKEKN